LAAETTSTGEIMSILDQVVGAVTGKMNTTQGGQSGLLEAVVGLVSNSKAGGLSGLVQAFANKGLGDIASSWVSTGKNLPVSPEQIRAVLGDGQIAQIAQKLGLSNQDASSGLAELLPNVVDKLTPGGSVPAPDVLQQGLSLLKSKFLG
jgi:uncharacterized protein YidB (DUF937 family)